MSGETMTPEALIARCEALTKAGIGHIHLTVRKPGFPRGARIKLLGPRSPLGRVCIVREAGEGFDVVAVFDPAQVAQHIRDISRG